MKSSTSFIAVTTFLVILLLSALPGHTIEHKFIEDFTMTHYKNVLNTTALWDTAAGELKLPPYELTLAGSYDTPGSAAGVAIAGDYAYIADYTSGLQIIDISDPTVPVLAGSYDTPGHAYDVAISGDHAFVVDAHMGLRVIDISDPTNPVPAGSYVTSDYAYGVAISGDYAYLAVNSLGFLVIDISDPTAPTLAGNYDTPGEAYAVTLSGDYAYVGDQSAGLTIIEISDPTNPVLAGSYATPSHGYVVAISGDYAYVAGWDTGGLQVIDISDPTMPALAGSCDTPGNAYDVAISGDCAYVADWDTGGLTAIDISDPTNPVVLSNYDTPSVARGVAVSGDYAYIADATSGLQVIRIADPMLPPRDAGDSDVSGRMQEPVIAGDYLYAVAPTATGGVGVFDISDPTSPTLAGSCATPGTLYDIVPDGDYLYLADAASGFRVLDISDPTNPFSIGALALPGWAKGLTVEGNYAYVSCDYTSQGFNVVDISDPTNPTLAGYHNPGRDIAVPITVAGNYAYYNTPADVRVVDITDPTTPTLVGSCATPSDVYRITIAGDYAYLACNTAGLQVMDITDPTTPTLVGSCTLSGQSTDIVIKGDYACVGGYTSGLHVIDISDPLNPVLIGTYAPPGNAYKLAMAGDYAYVVDDGVIGIHVVEVFQSRLDVDGDTGQSVAISLAADVLWARLTTTQTDTIDWELSVDNGGAWEPLVPGDTWHQFASPGYDLMWRSTHSYTTPGVNPACSELQIKLLYEFGTVEAIVDLPNDQGRQVQVSWVKSGHDYLGSSTPITEYVIYRKIDDDLPLASSSLNSRLETGLPALYPPGDWVFVASVPACCEEEYAAVIPTVVDSTIAQGLYNTTVFVRALTNTPGVHYDSYPDSGYSVDNIAPGVPLGLAVSYNTGSGNDMSWDPSPETDFQYYRVYRGDSETFTPSPGNLVHQTATPAWTDPEYDGWDVHYKVTTLDYAGNESNAASASTTTGDDTPHAPDAFALYQNVPNPFNPVTTISFDLPKASHVKLSVFNVKGELVSTIADRHMSEGHKEFIWAAVDGRGGAVSSGIYFYRLVAGDFVQTRKMVLLR